MVCMRSVVGDIVVALIVTVDVWLVTLKLIPDPPSGNLGVASSMMTGVCLALFWLTAPHFVLKRFHFKPIQVYMTATILHALSVHIIAFIYATVSLVSVHTFLFTSFTVFFGGMIAFRRVGNP